MSDGAKKNDEGTKVVDTGIKRAGRARVCTQCKFTTTDVKEFSNHRTHAHSEEKTEEKPNRRNSGRRKSSVVAETETGIKTEQKVTHSGTTVTVEKEQKVEREQTNLMKLNIKPEQSSEADKNIKVVSKTLDTNTEQQTNRTERITELETNKTSLESEQMKTDLQEEQMANEQISEEYLSSLSLIKSVNKREELKNQAINRIQNDPNRKRPDVEKTVLEKVNGHTEEIVLVNRVNSYDDQDDEPRLVIADDPLNDTDDLGEQSELDLSGSSLTRSGNIQNRTYMCSQCDYTTTSAKAYLHHQKDLHQPEIIIYECDICEYATKYKQKLPRHRKLHFTGKDGMNESDLDSSLTEREMKEMKEMSGLPMTLPVVNGDDVEDEGDIDEDEEEEMIVQSSDVGGFSSVVGGQPPEGDAAPVIIKKKRIRQEVDPLKYYEVVDDAGIKYACSKCGNVYKWRKSLNKHWKEKHFGESPDLTQTPQALQNYTLFSRYKSKFGAAGQPPAAANVVYGSAASAAQAAGTTDTLTPKLPISSGANTPKLTDSHVKSPVVMPKFIGPFVGGSSQSPFRPGLSPAQMKSILSQQAQTNQLALAMSEHERKKNELKQLMEAMRIHKQQEKERMKSVKSEPTTGNSQNEPLDFSKTSDIKTEPLSLDISKKSDIQTEHLWGNEKFREQMQELSYTMMMQNKANAIANAVAMDQSLAVDDQPAALQCTKCSFVAKTLVDYSSHMTLHLNKRAYKCAECQERFNGVDDLNKHFADNHSEKIEEHKQAIQKIPHGLQQTYHLLKMPLENISSLAAQELVTNEPKQLKCSMCSFVAKWPAELQKHAVSHSEERPFICMVCGSTYKWKWDLVKHFEKSHSTLPNPYKRRESNAAGTQSQTHSPSPTMDNIAAIQSKIDNVASTLSKTAVALLDAGMTGAATTIQGGAASTIQGGAASTIQGGEDQPRKRRLSETDMMDDEEFYLMEQQHKRMMAEKVADRQINLSAWKQYKSSEPSMDSGDSEGQNSSDGMVDPSSKQRAIADALKQRINNKNLEMANGNLTETQANKDKNGKGQAGDAPVILPYKCTICEYRARWPSEISQHMKNHSNEKPYHCPRCSYKSKWKWDVVKHLRRCGGGTVHDVIDTTKVRLFPSPNVTVMPQGGLQKPNAMSQPMFPSNMKFEPMSLPNQVSPVAYSSAANPVAVSLNLTSVAGGGDQPENMEFSPSLVVDLSQTQNGLAKNQSPVFRSLVNQGAYHCLECPFVGNNPAELRRHSVLHSENKPFMCMQCGYSSRWKCDLKKHMKTYGHFNSDQVDSDAENSPEKYPELNDVDSEDENRSTLYMCPKCPYNSYKKQAFELHLKVHGDSMEEESPRPPVDPVMSAKFKCTKCDYQGNDLSSFLQHKISHNNQPSTSNGWPSASGPSYVSASPQPGEVSNRTLHLKHRRKPIKQIHCHKCPFVCFKRVSMDNHEAMHVHRGIEAFLCMFCDYNAFSKALLLQHMRLHPEYNPSECADLGRVGMSELQEMEELEEKDVLENRKSTTVIEENNNDDDFEINNNKDSGDIMDLSKSSASVGTGSRSSTPADGHKSSASKNNNTEGALPCEWCLATFPNVATLYQHAQSLHPSQLKAQEAGDIAAKQNPNPPSQLEQIVKERQREYQVYHQFMAQQQPQIQAHLHSPNLVRRLVPLAPKPPQGQPQLKPMLSSNQPRPQMITLPENLYNKDTNQQKSTLLPSTAQNMMNHFTIEKARKSTSQQKRARSFQCTKCSFTAPNAVTYLRHIERHGSNCKHTCLYCDYSIDRLNLLYQHMKGTHGSMWQGTAEEKISLSAEDSNNNLIGLGMTHSPSGSVNLSEENSVTEELNESFNSSHNESIDGDTETRTAFEGAILSQMGSKGLKPVLVIKGEARWRGTPVQVCSLDGRKHYKCPKCLYISINVSNTASHVKQHGANRRYQCTQCDYSADNLSVHQHHIDTVHLKDPSFIQMAPNTPYMEENNNERAAVPMKSILPSPETRTSDVPFSCPKCPYKSQEKEKLQRHLEHHVYNGKYECQLCDYSVDQYNILKKHSKLHNRKMLQGNPSFTMDIDADDEDSYDEPPVPSQSHSRLEVSSDSKSKLQMEHDLMTKLKLGNGQLRFKCSTCPYTTYLRSEILEHRQGHITRNMYSCPLCNFSVNQFDMYHQHMRCHEQGKQTETTSDIQEICLNPFDEHIYQLIEDMPEEEDEEIGSVTMNEKQEYPERMEIEENVNDEIDADDNDDIDNDDEVALMEEELGVNVSGDDVEMKDGAKNLNAEGAFDNDLQFRSHKCQDCPFSSNSNAEYKKHLRLHGVNNKFICDYCNYSLDRINLLSQHRKLHFQEPDFDPTPKVALLLNKHHEDYESSLIKVGNDIAYPPSESKSEEKPAEFRYLYQKQADSGNGNGVSEDKIRYSCNQCPYRCNALKSFKCHIQMHGLTKKYRCDYCNWSADRLNLLYQHRKVHGDEQNFNPNPGDIVFLNREYALEGENNENVTVGVALDRMMESPFERTDMQHYQTPEKTASGQKLFFCKLCPFKTDSPNTYSYHKKLHLIQARFNCSECSFSINNADSLKEHIKLHRKEKEMMRVEILNTNSTDKKRHQCPKCPYSSPNKNLLANHTTMHSSGRVYKCNLCDFSADKHYHLQEHTRIHIDSNVDSDESGLEEIERAIQRSPDTVGPELYLNSPMNGDVDSDRECKDKPDHKCEKCPFTTPSKDKLGVHNVRHDMQNKNNCMFCTFSCGTEEELREHVGVHFGTSVDKEMLRVMKKHAAKHNLSKALDEADETSENKKTSVQSGEPDSTVNESPKKDNEDIKDNDKTEQQKKLARVYVCQYCDTEFDCKTTMVQHEKQHLVGYQF